MVIVSNVSQSTFDQAKNMIEWMSERVIEKFTRKREQPYDFKHIKLCQTLSEVSSIPEPKVILATPCDMESGFSLGVSISRITLESVKFLIEHINTKNSLKFKPQIEPIHFIKILDSFEVIAKKWTP